MYDMEWLGDSVQRLNRVLQSRSFVAVLRSAPAASKAELEDCEERLSVPLPRSYKALLECSNGLTLRVHPIGQEHIAQAWYYQVAIASASDCVDLTLRLRKYIPEHPTWGVPERNAAAITFARHMLAMNADNDLLIALHPGQSDLQSDAVYIMDFQDYLTAASPPYIRIADSVQDHMRRSIEGMIVKNMTFEYWA
jgi:hypothetical protein